MLYEVVHIDTMELSRAVSLPVLQLRQETILQPECVAPNAVSPGFLLH
jgi:hypothetical protein